MNSRHVFLWSGVTLLVAANLWQWLPREDGQTFRGKRSVVPALPIFNVTDFQLRTAGLEEERGPLRDLFRAKLPAAPKTTRLREPAHPLFAPLPVTPLPKTPEQIAIEAARAEITRIKLAGVVRRGGRYQAFLVNDNQLFLAYAGETVGERFRVEGVTADEVFLRDPSTNVSGQIPVSGK